MAVTMTNISTVEIELSPEMTIANTQILTNISQQFHDFISSCAKDMDIPHLNFTPFDFPRPESLLKNMSWREYIKIALNVVVILAILIGNGGVIVAVALNRALRTTINYYLTNLSVAGILICGFCLWVHLVNSITEPLYILGPFMCKFNGFTQMTSLTSSVLTLSAISCDRFVAIHYPFRTRVTKQRTMLVINVIWAISLIVSIPFLVYRKHHVIQWRDITETQCIESWPSHRQFDSHRGQCITSYPIKKLYYTMVTVMLFFIPVIVMATAYSMIIWKLWMREVPGESLSNGPNYQITAMKKVIKMICTVLLVFVISWMPLQLIVLYSQFGHSSHDYGELPVWFSSVSYISSFVAYSNSAINPIIYGGFNKNFRDALYSLLRCKWSKVNRSCMSTLQRMETPVSLRTRTVNCSAICKTPMVAFTDTNLH